MITNRKDSSVWDVRMDFAEFLAMGSIGLKDETPPGSWCLETTQKATSMATTGWKEGAEKARSISMKLENSFDSTASFAPENYWDVSGLSVDVGRFLEGEPECFMEERESETAAESSNKENIVKLAVNIWASGGVGYDNFMQRGYINVALIDLLERMGKRVELDMISSCGPGSCCNDRSFGSNVRVIRVRLKEAHDALDLDRIAFLLGHPASLRRLMINCYDAIIAKGSDPTLGSPRELPEDMREGADIYTPMMQYGMDYGQEVNQVKRMLAGIGIVLNEAQTTTK